MRLVKQIVKQNGIRNCSLEDREAFLVSKSGTPAGSRTRVRDLGSSSVI